MAGSPTGSQDLHTREERQQQLLPRNRIQLLALLAITVVALYLCYLIARPFLAPFAWALALSIVASPIHRWVSRWIPRPEVSAGLAVIMVAIVVIGPTYFVGRQLLMEATDVAATLSQQIMTGQLSRTVESIPSIAAVYSWLEENFELATIAQQGAGTLSNFVSSLVSGSVVLIVQLLITFFCLFYFFRDRDTIADSVRSLLPLSQAESATMTQRISDTVHATLFGTLVVSGIQGLLAGLMFWWLGLPGPVLWGVIMGLLNIIPILGAFVVWIPAAIWLVIQGAIVKAVILTLWGMIIVGLIDNVLYPVLVGNRMRLHTLVVFFAILGGLVVFGASGLILGPVVLAITHALLHVWRNRTADGRSAESTDGDIIIADGSTSSTDVLPSSHLPPSDSME